MSIVPAGRGRDSRHVVPLLFGPVDILRADNENSRRVVEAISLMLSFVVLAFCLIDGSVRLYISVEQDRDLRRVASEVL